MKEDQAILFPNPRILTAVYFGVLAIIATFIVNGIIFILGTGPVFSMFKSIIWAVIVASIFGALFGKQIIYAKQPYYWHVFFWAFLMVLIAIPFYNIGFLYLLKENYENLFAHSTVGEIVYLYFVIIFYNFTFAGIFYAIAAGLAAIYLRSYLVYYIIKTRYQRNIPKDEMQKN